MAGGLTRRDFLGVGAAGIAAGAGIAPRARAAAPAERGRARNLIFMVSDGMSIGTLSLADLFLRDRLGRETHWTTWMRSPDARRSLVETGSADSHVTDSAAASTAWSVGRLADNGAICVLPDGSAPAPLFDCARAAGRRCGVVTTTRVTHATPAAFYANQPDRDEEADIGRQLIERGVDLALGGGAATVPATMLAERPDITVLSSAAQLASTDPGAPAGPVFGLFARQHMAYEIDRAQVSPAQPSLAEMTGWALRRLAQSPEGFILQVEGGRVDHAAHANDAAGLLHDQWAFDEAVGVALGFAGSRDDTLLIVTTDHGNANPGLMSYGRHGRRQFERMQRAQRSFEWILERRLSLPGGDLDGFYALVDEACGQGFDRADAPYLARWLAQERIDPFRERARSTCPLGSVLSNLWGVAFLGPHHTSDQVILTAMGPGSEAFGRAMHLTDVHEVVRTAMDIPPTWSLDERPWRTQGAINLDGIEHVAV